MSGQQLYQSMPEYNQAITKGGQTSASWYRFFNSLYQGQPSGAEIAINVGISPYTFLAPTAGTMLIRGGTVSAIQLTRSITTLIGLTAGLFPLANGDQLTVTYTGLPTMVWYP
jgi:hypothetical protein